MTRFVGLRWCFLSAAIAFVLLLGACSRPHDDAQTASEVRNRISADRNVHSRDLTVQASNGVVTLSGYSQNDPERMAAAADAAQVSGVRTVINDLQVKPQPASTAPAQSVPTAPALAATAPPAQPAAAIAAAKPMASLTTKPPASGHSEAAHSSAVRRHTKLASARKHDLPVAPRSEASALPYVTGNAPAPSSTARTAAPATPSAAMPSPASSAAQATPVAIPPAPSATPTPAKVAESAKVAAPAPKPVTIPSGTSLSIRLIDKIDSSRSQPGQTFRATLDSPLADESGAVVIPAGQDVTGHVVEAKDAGRLTGKSALTLELTQLSVNGRYYTLHTSQFQRQGKSEGVSTAKKAGGGAALGALIGAIAGGGKGAAIGAVIGAGAGTGMSGMKKGKPVVLPSETLLSFNLQEPLSVMPSTAAGSTAARAESQTAGGEAAAESNPPSSTGDDSGPPVLKRRGNASQPK